MDDPVAVPVLIALSKPGHLTAGFFRTGERPAWVVNSIFFGVK